MKDNSIFLHQLYSPGGAQGLAALKNAPNTHPHEWANRNPYTLVSMLKHSWSVNLPDLGTWVVEHIPSPVSNFPSLLAESMKYDNTYVSDFLLADFQKYTEQKVDEPKAQRIGLSAALDAAVFGKLEYLVKITQIMRDYFFCGHFEDIASEGAGHTNVVQYCWENLSEKGKIHVAGRVICANNTDAIEWVAHRIPSLYWGEVEFNLDDNQKTLWREHTSVVQHARLEEQTQPARFSAPSKKI